MLFKSRTPSWAYLLIPSGLLPFAIVAIVLEKRLRTSAWPFCARCNNLRTGPMLSGLCVVVFAILAVLVLAAVVPQSAPYAGPIVLAFVALLFVGLLLAANAGWP
ncbi:hypothetical protein AB0880_10460 [Micromonospora chersina]|uniref:hypothetical protein n=1 Tax=Micromonospora chersina TaxID=47854 RepID=UPI003451317D